MSRSHRLPQRPQHAAGADNRELGSRSFQVSTAVPVGLGDRHPCYEATWDRIARHRRKTDDSPLSQHSPMEPGYVDGATCSTIHAASAHLYALHQETDALIAHQEWVLVALEIG